MLELNLIHVSKRGHWWPTQGIRRHNTLSNLVQVMPCCLTGPDHYLNQCWLIIRDDFWHSRESNFTEKCSRCLSIRYDCDNYKYKAITKDREQQNLRLPTKKKPTGQLLRLSTLMWLSEQINHSYSLSLYWTLPLFYVFIFHVFIFYLAIYWCSRS